MLKWYVGVEHIICSENSYAVFHKSIYLCSTLRVEQETLSLHISQLHGLLARFFLLLLATFVETQQGCPTKDARCLETTK